MGIKATWGNSEPITDPGDRGPRIKTSLVFYQTDVLGAIYLICPRLSALICTRGLTNRTAHCWNCCLDSIR